MPQSVVKYLVTYQQQTANHPARYMVHICNYSPNRRATPHMEYLENPIPLPPTISP
jgi:hypothetical protein